jgi:predicted RNA-binding Zn-ribbon protein involved in translation (DUF1610 family)
MPVFLFGTKKETDMTSIDIQPQRTSSRIVYLPTPAQKVLWCKLALTPEYYGPNDSVLCSMEIDAMKLDYKQRLLSLLIHSMNARIVRSEAHADCPFCGKEMKRGQNHFKFNEKGYHCFICGAKGILDELYEKVIGLGINVEMPSTIIKLQSQNDKPAWWESCAERVCSTFESHPHKERAWLQYAPKLSRATIKKFRLGFGKLPSCRCDHNRIIYPIIVNGEVKGFRGRAIEEKCLSQCAKWLQSRHTQSTLYGTHLIPNPIRPVYRVIITESPTAVMLLTQLYGNRTVKRDGMHIKSTLAVSPTNGAMEWAESWSHQLFALLPSVIVLATDNDDAGKHAALRIAEHLKIVYTTHNKERNTEIEIPAPILRHIQWSDSVPDKYDMKDWIESGCDKRAFTYTDLPIMEV